MNKQREALRIALDALEDYQANGAPFLKCDAAVAAIREALAEPEQEPVAWTTKGQIAAMDSGFIRYIEGRDPRFVLGRHDDVPLYTAPPARKPLTDEQINTLWINQGSSKINFARAIERAHGITND